MIDLVKLLYLIKIYIGDLSVHMILDNILCYKTLRTVSCNLTFQHNRQLFLLEDNLETRSLRKRQISLCEYPEGDIISILSAERA